MQLLRSMLALLLSAGFVACGGGGGTAAVALTGANGVPIAAQTNAAAQLASGMMELVQGFGEILDGQPAPACAAGSLDVVVNDAPPADTVSTGDSLTLTLRGCVIDLDGEPVTFDGSIALKVTEVVETPPDGWRASFAVTYGNLMVRSAADPGTLNGRLTADVDTTDGITYTTVVTGDLSLVATSGSETVSVKLGSFRSEETRNGMTGDYTTSFSGTFTSKGIGGSVEMGTVVPFSGNGEDPPTAGESFIRGANGSEVRVLAVGGTGVRIFIDVDGDGTPENTVDTTWNDIS